MKYCPECGLELKNMDKELKKTEEKQGYNKKYRVASSILTIISAGLCLILAIVFIGFAISHSNYSSYYDEYNYYNLKTMLFSMIAAISLFAFCIGLFCGITILCKKFYSIAMGAQMFLILVSLLSVGYSIVLFLFLGVPILTMQVISMFLLNMSKKDFLY